MTSAARFGWFAMGMLVGCGPSIETPSEGDGSDGGSSSDGLTASGGSTTSSSTTSGSTVSTSTTDPSTTSTTSTSTSGSVPPDCTPATWNPNDAQDNIVLSDGNLTATVVGDSVNDTVRATVGVTSGRWYWEVQDIVLGLSSFNGICVGDGQFFLEVDPCPTGASYDRSGFICAGPESFLTADAFGPGSIIGVALDADNAAIWYHRDGVWQLGDGPAVSAGTPIGIPAGQPMFPCLNLSEDDVFVANFGQSPFAFEPPPGFTPGVCG